MYACITATGVQNVMSQYFELLDFEKVPLLVNMGTPDEWGNKFPEDIILNKKKPANFMLEYPTEIIYLDPIFYLLLESGKRLLTKEFTGGLHAIPEKIDKEVLSSWMRQHKEKVWQHTKSQRKVGELLDALKSTPRATREELKTIYSSCGIFTFKSPVTPLSCLSAKVKGSQKIEENNYGVSPRPKGR